MDIRIERVADWAAVAARWRALEAACAPGLFRRWVFLGCEAERRFAGGLLLSVVVDGADAALALLGVRGRRAFLHETGDAAQDAVFIEHNGLLLRPGQEAVLRPALRAVLRRFAGVALSGVDAQTFAAAGGAGVVRLLARRLAPTVELAGLQGPLLDGLSANSRQQIRRAIRSYGNPPVLQAAASVQQAQAFFEAMVPLHQARWQARGKPGAFADPEMLRFHRKLIGRGWQDGHVLLLRVGNPAPIGYLYCLAADGTAHSYQGGFDYGPGRNHPGLVCHALAIEHCRGLGYARYDLLGGADRYKLTFTKTGPTLFWAILHRRWSAGALETMARAAGENLGLWPS